MTKRAMTDLTEITDMHFRVEQSKLRDILKKESEMRRMLKDLDEQHANARDVVRNQITLERSFGGDVLWHAWVSRSRRELQIRLAQILAVKGQKIQNMRVAFGRKLASEQIEHQRSADLLKSLDKKSVETNQINQILSHGLFSKP